MAACTPRDVEVQVVDEYVEPIPYDTDADLVALSAKTSCVTHAYEVAAEFRERGKKVVLGGIHASLRPDEALEHVDYVVIGEAEKTWPQFVAGLPEGRGAARQADAGFPPMEEVPVPAWDRIEPAEFLFHQLQTTRGCPFMCRFCSVPDISGQYFRFKPVENVVEEIRALPRAGRLKDQHQAALHRRRQLHLARAVHEGPADGAGPAAPSGRAARVVGGDDAERRRATRSCSTCSRPPAAPR